MDAESPGPFNMDQFKAAPNQLVVGQQMTMIAAEIRQTLKNERKKLELAREDQERRHWEQSANQIVLKDGTRRENFRWKNATCRAEIVPGDGSNQKTIHGWIQKMYGSQDDTHLALLMH